MRHRVGIILLGLSACGYPLTQVAIRRLGLAGAGIVEAVCVGLVVRDAALIATGTPCRLRRGPAVLLWLELGAGIAAAVTGLHPLVRPRTSGPVAPARPGALDIARRAAVAALFGLHTVRFGIYLRPDRGLARTGRPNQDAAVEPEGHATARTMSPGAQATLGGR